MSPRRRRTAGVDAAALAMATTTTPATTPATTSAGTSATITEALPATAAALASSLTAWFADHARDLPWRKERTPYRVWLSEVMLQQTRVAVVVDYFNRFTARFPDVAALAAAAEDDVLSLWSGLGYYSRGRNLHRAARVVVDDHGGVFPSTRDGLRALPGVGDYTSAAVASLAFGERVPVVDGNVLRVLARLCGDATPVDSPAGVAAATTRAAALVLAGPSAEAVNEGLMELGALVCTPRAPACGVCPWQASCRARAAGTATQLPVKARKAPRKALRVACVVVVDAHDRLLLERRAGRGLFGGLWEPPGVVVDAPDPIDLPGLWAGVLAARGLSPSSWSAPLVVQRVLTHRDLRFEVVVARVAPPAVGPAADGRWFAPHELARVGISTAVRAVLAAAHDVPMPP